MTHHVLALTYTWFRLTLWTCLMMGFSWLHEVSTVVSDTVLLDEVHANSA